MELKELYQEIILDHAKTQGIKASAKVLTMMLKHIILFVGIKFIFLKLDKDKNISGLSFEGRGMCDIFSICFNSY